jgi:hypothetical protein
MKLEDYKMYDVNVTGEVVLDDATKLPKKDKDGNFIVKYMRDSNPSVELQKVGLGSGRFFQTEMIETNTIAATLALPNGKTADIGPLSAGGINVNLFEARQREPFKAVALKIAAGEFDVLIPAGEKVKPVVRVKNFVMPGEQVEYNCGFDYYLHRRNATSKKMEPILTWQYNNEGKLVQEKVIRHTGQIFLFGNELEAKAAHIQSAINGNLEFKVKAAGTSPRAEAAKIAASSPEVASDDIPTV